MTRVQLATTELEQLARHSAAPFKAAMDRLARAQFSRGSREAALAGLRTLLAETMTLADLLGRRRLLLEADAFGDASGPDILFTTETEISPCTTGAQSNIGPATLLFIATPIFPHVTFHEAVRDIVSREPRLAVSVDGQPLWKFVSELYQTSHSFALAQSADIQLTQRIQKLIGKFAKEGETLPKAESAITEIGNWTTAYAETVYRTNLATAYSAGRFQQAADPDVARVIGAFEYQTANDSDVRRGRREDNGENHLAAEGLIAATTDSIWDSVAPPSGFNCRCGLRMVPRKELSSRGLIRATGEIIRAIPPGFSSFARAPGFGQSRARSTYA